MAHVADRTKKAASPYSALITGEQFLFYETRTTARLMQEGLSEEEIVSRIAEENLFQYPTEKSLRKVALACIRRLRALRNEKLIAAIAEEPSGVAKQICLYAMMCQHYLVREFMLTVVGEKYKNLDLSFGREDINLFFLRLQEQDDWVAEWSDQTVSRIKQVLVNVLVENGYLDNRTSTHLNPVWLSPVLEEGIRENQDEIVLPAFHCFS